MIPLAQPNLKGKELEYVSDCINTGWISKGKYIEKFEEIFARYHHMKYAVSVFNGTVALHLALHTLGITHGDEVIVPNLTYIASANAVRYCGAKVVLVDIDEKTWNIDPKKIEAKITRRTKAIMPVHIYGLGCSMEKIMRIAHKHNLFVVEDCAEAMGASINGQRVGTFGDINCFSFFGNKLITCFPERTGVIIKNPKYTGKGRGRCQCRLKNIELIQEGDTVLTYNTTTSAKEFETVVKKYEREYSEDLLELSFSNKNNVKSTPNHEFYVINKGWINADKLQIDDEVLQTFIYNPDVEIVKIVKIEKRKYMGKVYNIETEKNHNYFAKGILVHNCGEGGMCLTNDKALAERMKHLRNHAIVSQGAGYQHDEVGFNYRMTNIQAAIGLAQIQRIDDFLQKRKWIQNSYNKMLKNKVIFQEKEKGAIDVCWLYSVLTPLRDKIIEALKEHNIESRPFFIPLSQLKPYETKEKFPISERISKLGINLPTYTDLHSTEIMQICDIITSIK